MIGVDPLTIGSLMVLAAGGGDGLKCELPKPAAINVTPKTLDVRYDYSKGLVDIQKVKSDTIDPHAFGGRSLTQGFMRGGIKFAPRVKLSYLTYEGPNKACVWYDEIDVVIEIDPTIVIAKEVYQNRCMHAAVKAHELKHVKVDRQIVNKYAKSIGRKLNDRLSAYGFKSKLIDAAATQRVMKRMQDEVYNVVRQEYRAMEQERIERQRAVDTKQEYERVSAQCPDFGKAIFQR